jgi:Zn finger protein HypA/HybF involved in hydrogenase expression
MKIMCEFCKKFNFSKARTRVDEDGAIIELALCNTEFPKEEQFKFCPVCGRDMRKEDEGK